MSPLLKVKKLIFSCSNESADSISLLIRILCKNDWQRSLQHKKRFPFWPEAQPRNETQNPVVAWKLKIRKHFSTQKKSQEKSSQLSRR